MTAEHPVSCPPAAPSRHSPPAPSRQQGRQRRALVRALQERAREDDLPGLALASLYLADAGGRDLGHLVACHSDALGHLTAQLADEVATLAAVGATEGSTAGLPCRARSLRGLAELLAQTAASLETIAVDALGPSAGGAR